MNEKRKKDWRNKEKETKTKKDKKENKNNIQRKCDGIKRNNKTNRESR